MRKLLLLLALCLAGAASLASAAAAEPRYTVVKIDVRKERLELFLHDDSGAPFKRFDRLEAWLAARNRQLVFAMNAGMYHADFSPVGLLVQEGREEAPLNLAAGAGNFFLKPNGVFLVSDAGPRVVESSEYAALPKRAFGWRPSRARCCCAAAWCIPPSSRIPIRARSATAWACRATRRSS